MACSGRFYFTRDGVELKDHPLNGAVIAGAGPYVDIKAANRRGATAFDRRRTVVYVSTKAGDKAVTTADFGEFSVSVLEWWPEVSARCRFMLVAK